MRWWIRSVLLAVASPFIAIAVWAVTYPDPDPKNIEYVLWKSGLHDLDLDRALEVMIGDCKAKRLVVGKTKAELRERFEKLVAAADASPFLRSGYENFGWKGRDVLFLRSSPWMGVLQGDLAVDLVLMKGY
jgi:hypothetical protein